MNAATGTSARPGTWWDHFRERASNGRIPGEPIMAREPEFKILKNTEGEYHWHLEAASSRVVAWLWALTYFPRGDDQVIPQGLAWSCFT